jgi:hypothetical protein
MECSRTKPYATVTGGRELKPPNTGGFFYWGQLWQEQTKASPLKRARPGCGERGPHRRKRGDHARRLACCGTERSLELHVSGKVDQMEYAAAVAGRAHAQDAVLVIDDPGNVPVTEVYLPFTAETRRSSARCRSSRRKASPTGTRAPQGAKAA